jgi:hypothetical protein
VKPRFCRQVYRCRSGRWTYNYFWYLEPGNNFYYMFSASLR